jgi:hypothetical protein
MTEPFQGAKKSSWMNSLGSGAVDRPVDNAADISTD